MFVFLLLVLVLVAGALLLLRYVYGDAVKQNLLAAINNHIQQEISVEDIEVDVFGSFPYASLRLKNLQTVEPGGKTLIKAAGISILFNYMDMIKGRYEIERIDIRDAFINLIHFQDGTVNYDLFKKSPGNQAESNQLNIRLKEVHLINVEVSYLHFPADQEYLFKVNRGKIQGDFSQQDQRFSLSGDFYSTHIRSGKNVFFKDYPLQLTLNIQLEDAGKLIRINQGLIETSGLNFNLKGTINTGEKTRELDLQLECARSKLKDLVRIIPPAYLEPVKDYTMEGEVGFTSAFKGPFSGNHLPAIHISFWLENGKLALESAKFNDLNLKGSFSNGKSRSESGFDLIIEQVKASFNGGDINGSIRIEDFTRPLVTVAFTSLIDLQKIKPLIKNEKLQSIDGSIKIDIKFQNRLKDFRKFTLQDFISSKTSGSLEVNGVNFELTNYPLKFNDFQGSFTFSNKDLLVKSFSGKAGANDFKMDGSFRNILAYTFLPDESVFIDAGFKSHHLDLETLLQANDETSNQKNQLNISPRLNFQLRVNIDDFRFRRFNATDVIGKLSQQKGIFRVDQATFLSMDGRANMTGSIRPIKPEEYRINCDAEVQDVDIRKLFYDFGNFGQDNILSENLAGKVTAQVHYESGLTSDLSIDPVSVYCLSDLVITDGELIDYAPMYKLSRFIQKDALAHIRFSEMKNRIEIRDKKVFIPSMDVFSNTLNLTLFGQHGFDNTIDYHVQLLLSELLGSDNKPQVVPGENFVKEDGSGKTKLFFHMTGNAEDPLISYDTREVSKKIKESLQTEKSNFRELFKNSNNDNLTDSLIIKETQGKDFKIEWEEQDTSNTIDTKSNKKKKEKIKKPVEKEFIIQWDETKDTIR